MPQNSPARYFRATAVFGVLAAGLLTPAAASAQNVSPAGPSAYPLAFTAPGSLPLSAPSTSALLRGAFDDSGKPLVAALHPSQGDGLPGTVDVVAPSGDGPTPVQTGASLRVKTITAATTGAVLSPGRESLVVIGQNDAVPMLEVKDWHAPAEPQYTSLQARPVGVAVGRFLDGRGPVIAVSMTGDRLAMYTVVDGELSGVWSGSAPSGPLAVVRRPYATIDGLLSAAGGPDATLRFLNPGGGGATLSAPVPFAAPDTTTLVSQDADAIGRTWFGSASATPDGATFGAYGYGWTQSSGALVAGPTLQRSDDAVTGAPLVGDFQGRGARDVLATLDGQGLRTLDLNDAQSEQHVPAPNGQTGVPVDVDADGRDDVVAVDGDRLRVFRNVTGDVETTPHTDGKTIEPSVADPRAARRIVTKRTFRLTRPAGDTAMWDCVLVDADGGRQGCMMNADITVPADGDYTLEVRRQEEGHNFWSPVETIALHVDSTVPGKPQIQSAPDALTSYPQFIVGSIAGIAVEYQLDDEQDWHRLDGPYLNVDAPDGPHRVRFRAIDPIREVASETTKDYAFTVDRTRPKAPTKIAGPADVTSDRDATFAFEGEPDSRFECLVDRVELDGLGGGVAARGGLVWDDCASPFVLRDLALGSHVVTVRQVDAAGNRGAQTSWTWEIVEKAAEPVAPMPAPVAPAKEDKPAPAATTPAPAPAPAAAEPVKAKLSVGAPAGKGRTPVATATGRRVAVGCAAPGAEGYRCAVTVTRGGKTVGGGRRTGAGLVPVNLDKATAKKVQRLGGLKVRVQLTVTTADGETTKAAKTVRVLPRKVVVVPTDGLFAFASAAPTRGADALAKDIAGQLDGARTITIVGHTDAVGAADVNRRLGQRRAEAFRRLLAKHGFAGEVRVTSAGDTQPRASNGTAGGRALNRRVEIDVRY